MNLKPVLHPFQRPKLWLPTFPGGAQSTSIRTIPQLVDYNAEHNPEYPFCYQVQKADDSLRLLDITHQQLKNAVLQCQEWLTENVVELERPFVNEDGSTTKGRPVALFMESDVGLWVHLLALMGLGVPVLLLSARLSPTAVHHLLNTTGTSAVLASQRLRGTANEGISILDPTLPRPTIYERKPYELFLRPNESYISRNKSVCSPGYHTNETDTRVIILHSSGTTGLPKPIFQSHEYLLGFAAAHEFSSEEEAQHSNFSTLPLYHVSYISDTIEDVGFSTHAWNLHLDCRTVKLLTDDRGLGIRSYSTMSFYGCWFDCVSSGDINLSRLDNSGAPEVHGSILPHDYSISPRGYIAST